MKEYYGNAASGGIAVGKIKKLQIKNIPIDQQEITDTAQERKRLEDAVCRVDQRLGLLYENALQKAGEEHAEIFSMHRMMLKDKDYLAHINQCIEGKKESAEKAVRSAESIFSEVFRQMPDDYMQARAIDIVDISRHLIEALTNSESDVQLYEPSIIVAEDLTPSQTMRLNKDMVLAFAVRRGSQNSHTAILSRMLEIPAILGMDFDLADIREQELACVDGNNGTFVIDPDEETIRKMEDLDRIEKKKKEILRQFLK
ncbi:phosphoenolpyruvate-utilizing N-terminal domain-containing protein [Lacrimispora brassicae]